MKVELYNLFTKVVDATDEEDCFLQRILQYVERNDMFRYNQNTGKVDLANANPVRYLYNTRDYTFAGGLTAFVRRKALREGFSFEYVDKRVKPCEPVDADLSFIDRPFLLEAVEACVSRTRGIVCLPMGSGKTSCIVGITLRVPTTWMILTPTVDTFVNAVKRYEKIGIPVGRVGKGKTDFQRVTIAMMQTVQRRLEAGDQEMRTAVEEARAIAVDECHVAAAPGRLRTIMSFKNTVYRIGFSGTPMERPDGRNLITMGALGDVIYRRTADDEQVKQVLAKGTVRMVACRQHGDAKTYRGAYHELVANSVARNLLVTAIARCAAKPALVLVREVKHAENLTAQLERTSLRVKMLTGDADTDERLETLQTIETNDVDVVVATIFQMAVDIPGLRSVINAAAGDSPVATLQRAGRGSRRTDTKDEYEVWDVWDEGTGAADWLANHSRRRRKVYESASYTVLVAKDLLPLALGPTSLVTT